jgi:hypothetical protein
MDFDFKEKYPELKEPNERTLKAIDLYKKIAHQAQSKGWKIAFLSGLAADANCGYLTRQHRDADIISHKDTAQEIKKFLESEGHVVYEPEETKGECLKVDQAEINHPMRSHCDIHYFWEEDDHLIIPAFGKKLKFTSDFENITVSLEFLGEKARFLKPKYIIEEKIGWRDQIGLTFREEYAKEIEKIQCFIDLQS